MLYLERKNSINGHVALKLQWRLIYSKYGYIVFTFLCCVVSLNFDLQALVLFKDPER